MISSLSLKAHVIVAVLSWVPVTQARNQRIAKSLFDFWYGSTSLCPWERHFISFSIFGSNSLHVVFCVGVVFLWYTRKMERSTYCFQTKFKIWLL